MPRTPDDALEAVRALARVADPTPARDHSVFWTEWFRRVGAHRPELRPRDRCVDPTDPTATHGFDAFDGVPIGCRLTLPEGPALGGLVCAHGASTPRPLEEEARRWDAVVGRGVAVLQVRVRGFPGSRAGGAAGLPDPARPGWFVHGLDTGDATPEGAMSWVLPRAVADLADACRALRNALHGRSESTPIARGVERPPVFLHGDSLGAGLAVIVAAQLVGRLRHEPMIDRLSVALPSLGDWPWRLDHPAGGVGVEVRAVLDRLPERRGMIVERLRLLDAAVHATRVRRPVLAMLAETDPVVPAPTAGAIFNALGTDPGDKWRFVVPVGHAEAGLANARRHALFERCLVDFLDPARQSWDAMRAWEPVLHAGGSDAPAPPTTGPSEPASGVEPPATLFVDAPPPLNADASLIGAYERAARTLDALPYTPELEAIAAEAGAATARDALHRLHTLRKAGRLPRLGRAGERPPTIEPVQEELLRALVVEAAGSLGARDRLPHTPEFDALVERFNRESGLRLSHHDLWRVVAKLAK